MPTRKNGYGTFRLSFCSLLTWLTAQPFLTFRAYFSVVVLYDSVVLVLSLVKTISIIREGAQSRILQVLVRDQIVFFGTTLLVNVANLIYYGVSDPQRNRWVPFCWCFYL